LAVDVSNWLRPDAATSADRLFLLGLRAGERPGPADPGLAVLLIGALESGRTSWSAVRPAHPGAAAPGRGS
jgi:hypothetical protein